MLSGSFRPSLRKSRSSFSLLWPAARRLFSIRTRTEKIPLTGTLNAWNKENCADYDGKCMLLGFSDAESGWLESVVDSAERSIARADQIDAEFLNSLLEMSLLSRSNSSFAMRIVSLVSENKAKVNGNVERFWLTAFVNFVEYGDIFTLHKILDSLGDNFKWTLELFTVVIELCKVFNDQKLAEKMFFLASSKGIELPFTLQSFYDMIKMGSATGTPLDMRNTSRFAFSISKVITLLDSQGFLSQQSLFELLDTCATHRQWKKARRLFEDMLPSSSLHLDGLELRHLELLAFAGRSAELREVLRHSITTNSVDRPSIEKLFVLSLMNSADMSKGLQLLQDVLAPLNQHDSNQLLIFFVEKLISWGNSEHALSVLEHGQKYGFKIENESWFHKVLISQMFYDKKWNTSFSFIKKVAHLPVISQEVSRCLYLLKINEFEKGVSSLLEVLRSGRKLVTEDLLSAISILLLNHQNDLASELISYIYLHSKEPSFYLKVLELVEEHGSNEAIFMAIKVIESMEFFRSPECIQRCIEILHRRKKFRSVDTLFQQYFGMIGDNFCILRMALNAQNALMLSQKYIQTLELCEKVPGFKVTSSELQRGLMIYLNIGLEKQAYRAIVGWYCKASDCVENHHFDILLSWYAKRSLWKQALSLFEFMLNSRITLTSRNYANIIRVCKKSSQFKKARGIIISKDEVDVVS